LENRVIGISWRIASRGFDPAAFCRKYGLRPSRIFTPGEKHGRRRIKFPSCNIKVPYRGSSTSGAVAAVVRFAERHRDAFMWLGRKGVRNTLDIGIAVGPKTPTSIGFEPEQLRIFERLGVRLEVSAYPVSNGRGAFR